MSEIVLLLTTWPDETGAKDAAQGWLQQNLVACVNILPRMTSLYRWEGELNTGTEYQMILKTTAARAEALREAIVATHPYECPEILQIDVSGGHDEYLNWIKGNTE
jgi:periplasmic divalent cation tolerance protein